MKCDRSVGRIVLDALRLGKVSFGHGPVVRLKHRVVLCCAVRKCNNPGNDTLDFVRFAGLLGAKSVSFECWKSWNREIVDIWLWSVPRCLLLAACCLLPAVAHSGTLRHLWLDCHTCRTPLAPALSTCRQITPHPQLLVYHIIQLTSAVNCKALISYRMRRA